MTLIVGALVFMVSMSAPLGQAAAPPSRQVGTPRFLLGTWDGTSAGQPGTGTVRRAYRLVLRDQFIEVRNTSTYSPTEKNPKGEVHDDVGYISYDQGRKTFVFRQFHVEGFVNTYVAQPGPSSEIVFTSESIENIPAGWRPRETYRVITDGELLEVFELAQPGKDFTPYSETKLRRVR